MRAELLAYAQSFVSFFVQNLGVEDLDRIRAVILFGSVASGEADKHSDVDIFVDVPGRGKGIERLLKSSLKDFSGSQLFKKYWKLLGIENDIRPLAGNLDEWGDLKPSIISGGIVLYGKYKASFKGRPHVILFWDKIKKESNRVLLSKRLYGYTYKGRSYSGVLGRYKGRKLGSNCIIVSLEAAQEVLRIFKRVGTAPKRMYVEEVR